MRFNGLILALSMSALLAFGQAKKDGEQPDQNHKKSDSGGKNEGIKVHGHWVIDVKNPDGSLAGHRDFENSRLRTEGNSWLGCFQDISSRVATTSLLLATFAHPRAAEQHWLRYR